MKASFKKALRRLHGMRRMLIVPSVNGWLLTLLILTACFSDLSLDFPAITFPVPATFTSFETNYQTLPASIQLSKNLVQLEVGHHADLTKLTPTFTLPSGYFAYVNGIPQVSGTSSVDFSQPVTYELKDKNNLSIPWKVSVIPLGCKILIDASHDGGVWWYPQYEATGFNANEFHQGQAFADLLRNKGFAVSELGRGIELTEEMFFGYYIVIRAGGFQPYTQREIEVYAHLIDRGMNLVFFTDHKKFDLVDELGDRLGLRMEGTATGVVSTFASHEITANLNTIDYIAGSVLTNADQNPNITILGWLGPNDFADLNFNDAQDVGEPLAPPVMGIVKYEKSEVFFIGDMNGIQVRPQPFIDNLLGWMGKCF